MTATDIHTRLRRLRAERVEAKIVGLAECREYMEDLEDEIAECSHALARTAVTEIAILRGELFGREFG